MGRTAHSLIFAGILALVFTHAINAPAASREKVLYTFSGGADGANPVAKLIFDTAGNLYGTTSNGGTYNAGTVFELKPSIAGSTETILYSFTGGTDGAYPLADLAFDSSGNLYGTAMQGGVNGFGVVFELSPSSGGSWNEIVLHSCTGIDPDGLYPMAGLIPDKIGNFFGITNADEFSRGAVFELTQSVGAWTYSELLAEGSTAGLTFDNAANLYGTNGIGYGRIFELPFSGGYQTEIFPYTFTGGSDGEYPLYGRLIFDSEGHLYGTTQEGGSYGLGTVFELTSNSGVWTETVLHSFSGGSDGAFPLSGLAFDRAGHLFGTTQQGGAFGYGTVFELRPVAVNQWSENDLHDFAGGHDGAYPIAGVSVDNKGRLYGTTPYGGRHNAGVVFAIRP